MVNYINSPPYAKLNVSGYVTPTDKNKAVTPIAFDNIVKLEMTSLQSVFTWRCPTAPIKYSTAQSTIEKTLSVLQLLAFD